VYLLLFLFSWRKTSWRAGETECSNRKHAIQATQNPSKSDDRRKINHWLIAFATIDWRSPNGHCITFKRYVRSLINCCRYKVFRNIIHTLATRPGYAWVQCWYESVSLLCMLYTYKPSSWITPSIEKTRIKMRWVVLKIYAYTGTDFWKRLCFIICYNTYHSRFIPKLSILLSQTPHGTKHMSIFMTFLVIFIWILCLWTLILLI
jgi:hypothetical protein